MRRRIQASERTKPPKVVSDEPDFDWEDKGKGGRGSGWQGLNVFLFFVSFYVAMALLTGWWLYSTREPLGFDAPQDVFSEARALAHVQVLSKDIGLRMVSTPNLKKAAQYIEQECRKLASLLNEDSGMVAEVDVENASGSWTAKIFNSVLVSAYRNLTNIVLYIAPKGMANKKALLLNAHYDSANGSPGASDCGVCVGIGLEIARAIVRSGSSLTSPIIFLFNGGEETLMQAAHGFMQHSKWATKVGAFVNLESTGSGGLPLLFQYSGLWALDAYVKGAKMPRGTALAQDFFMAKLIPADTDFRVLSYDHEGSLPGLDIATILDAAAYHTYQDSLERIRPGTTQEYGETVFGVVKQFLSVMADGVPSGKEKGGGVFFDVFHSVMVFYELDTAKWLHFIPLGVAAIAFIVQNLAYQGGSNVAVMQMKWAILGVIQSVASLVLAVAFPIFAGAAWVQLTGKPMFWFSHHSSAYIVYGLAAMAGSIIPWPPRSHGLQISSSVLGISITLSVLGITMAFAGLGSSYHCALLGFCGSLISMVIPKNISSLLWTSPSLLFAIFPVAGCMCCMFILAEHIMEKITLAGSDHSGFGLFVPELVVGGLVGVSVWMVALLLSPQTVGVLKQKDKRLMLVVLLAASGCILPLVGYDEPFSEYRPRRTYLLHVHRQKDAGMETFWGLTAWDPLPQEPMFPMNFQTGDVGKTSIEDWIIIFPLHKRCWGHRVSAPSVKDPPWGSFPPAVVNVGSVDNDEQQVKRLLFEIQWEKPGWGVMNVTGHVKGWSFTEMEKEKVGDLSHFIRFNQDAEDSRWPFWIEVPSGEALRIEIGLAYFLKTPEIEAMAAEMPSSISLQTATVFMNGWEFN